MMVSQLLISPIFGFEAFPTVSSAVPCLQGDDEEKK
jgi:hypothetical protein